MERVNGEVPIGETSDAMFGLGSEDGPVVLGIPGVGSPAVSEDVLNRQMVALLAEEYARVRDMADDLNERKKLLGERILSIVGPGETVELDNGLTVVTLDESVQNRFDTARFKGDQPEVYKLYLKQNVVKPHVRVSGHLVG